MQRKQVGFCNNIILKPNHSAVNEQITQFLKYQDGHAHAWLHNDT